MEIKPYEDFMQDFPLDYLPKYGFCPLNIVHYIKIYYDVDYKQANIIYTKLSKYRGSLVRLNDFLYEQIHGMKDRK